MTKIRNKFFIYIGLLAIFIVGILILANNLLLEDYYRNQKQSLIKDYYTQINALDESQYLSTNDLIRQIVYRSNIDLSIVDVDRTVIYNSRNDAVLPPPPPLYSQILDETDDYKVLLSNDPNLPGDMLILSGLLDNGYEVQLRVPIAAIKENVMIINQFLLYVGLFGVLAAVGLSFVMANYFTKPIRKINEIAKKMKDLDFNHLVDIKSKDELGELASSINNLASTLDQTINNLNLELEMNKKLSTKRRELLNNVSHELKTPLALIIGYSEGLKLNIHKDKGKTDYYVKVIMDEAEGMKEIVEDLLEIENMDFNFKVNIEKKINLNEYLDHSVKKYQKEIKEKGLKWIDERKENFNVDIDPYLVERIVTNFMTNAIHYCEEKGTIKLKTMKVDKHVRVIFYNTYHGFDEKEVNQIWDSFYKVDQARNRDVGGHGLGLSIVKAIQEQLYLKYGVNLFEDGVEFWFDTSISE